ncbi:hypothetical protein ABZU32_21305 [Sphaerisporangium sp. NPDC005288]|uniref:hypothetical protein n=1 Tax=Sphaerisporangium sp. NPDC005288 TaxID=3155114 RepID=UPI0033A1E31B
MPNELIDLYLRTLKTDLPDDICWIVVQPLSGALTVKDAVTRIGGRLERCRDMTPVDAYLLSPGDALSFERTETGVAVLQVAGFLGMIPAVIEPLSRGARAWVAHWDVNAEFTMLH